MTCVILIMLIFDDANNHLGNIIEAFHLVYFAMPYNYISLNPLPFGVDHLLCYDLQ